MTSRATKWGNVDSIHALKKLDAKVLAFALEISIYQRHRNYFIVDPLASWLVWRTGQKKLLFRLKNQLNVSYDSRYLLSMYVYYGSVQWEVCVFAQRDWWSEIPWVTLQCRQSNERCTLNYSALDTESDLAFIGMCLWGPVLLGMGKQKACILCESKRSWGMSLVERKIQWEKR